MQKLVPEEVTKANEKNLRVRWNDGLISELDVVELRRSCVCAHCVDEMTRERILKPQQVPETVRPIKVRNLGRYALVVDWTDGHTSSIYSWELLRSISERSASLS